MEKYELAAQKFIDTCAFKDDITAVFLTGSYAFDNADEYSDIDLLIVLDDKVDYRERGNLLVDGFLIEYFANPVRQTKRYINDNFETVQIHEINMILGGRVIYDKGKGCADELISFCKEKSLQNFPEMSDFALKSSLYFLRYKLNELKRVHQADSADFAMHFYGFIKEIFASYSRFCLCPVPQYQKLYKWLFDAEYFRNYGLPQHKDSEFINMIKLAFGSENKAEMFALAEKIYEHVIEKMGGFDINTYVLRSPCE